MSTALDPSVLEALKGYDSPTLSNAIELFDVRPWDEGYLRYDVRCMFPDLPRMVGYAATATMRARGKADGYGPDELIAHVRSVPGPRIVVVQDLDDEPAHGALWGEVMATTFQRLGCAGVVTDGSVRDLDEAHEMGFQFFARAASVSHGYARVESVGEPVTVGGALVRPGDLLHADKHGVLLVPAEIAAQLPAAADRLIAAEQEYIGWIRSDEFDPAQFPERRSKMKDAFSRATT
ncbi:RraA family protein [Pseudonocardia zijingensis]|jgi:regulator of RNase E activity RraA|uniref:Putative 4-hydroxy-4-methyl-2-oxoglutarate aldolase n=1 Tax=Pseudonocardia zijingensis TaxID=153376 RepID=A0ABP3YNT2_9PSEU